jgi:glycosyltransferase involved in cell wall biosynthesis
MGEVKLDPWSILMSLVDEMQRRFLLQEEYLGNDKPVNKIVPLVSVTVPTYQHVNYIRNCLDGILTQNTDFPYEILLGEDGSTDGTREICKEYAEKYPNIIRLFLRDRDTSCYRPKDIFVCFNWFFLLISARGKFVAICEGDDYWIDPDKLQKQVTFLEDNPECSWCFHPARIVYADAKGLDCIVRPIPIPKNHKFSAKDIIRGGGGFYITASSMFHTQAITPPPDWYLSASAGDYALALLASCKGEAGYIDDIMCVYRRNVPGSWSQRVSSWRNLLIHYRQTEDCLRSFNSFSSFRYEKYVNLKILQNKCDLFLLALYLPGKSGDWNERFQRLQACGITYAGTGSVSFYRTLLCAVVRKLTNRISQLNGNM